MEVNVDRKEAGMSANTQYTAVTLRFLRDVPSRLHTSKSSM